MVVRKVITTEDTKLYRGAFTERAAVFVRPLPCRNNYAVTVRRACSDLDIEFAGCVGTIEKPIEYCVIFRSGFIVKLDASTDHRAASLGWSSHLRPWNGSCCARIEFSEPLPDLRFPCGLQALVHFAAEIGDQRFGRSFLLFNR